MNGDWGLGVGSWGFGVVGRGGAQISPKALGLNKGIFAPPAPDPSSKPGSKIVYPKTIFRIQSAKYPPKPDSYWATAPFSGFLLGRRHAKGDAAFFEALHGLWQRGLRQLLTSEVKLVPPLAKRK